MNVFFKFNYTVPCISQSSIHVLKGLYIFKKFVYLQMACSTIRYGVGVTEEVGMDFVNMKAKSICVMTDPNLSQKQAVKTTLNALAKENLKFDLYDKVRVEPTETR